MKLNAFWIGFIVLALLFIPYTRDLILNQFRSIGFIVIVVIGGLLLYGLFYDSGRLPKARADRFLAIGVIAVGLVFAYVMWPGIFSLDRQAMLGSEPIIQPAAAGDIVYNTIPLLRNDRVTTAILKVDARERVTCPETEPDCDTIGAPVPYDVDVGVSGKDFAQNTFAELDITKQVNDWMEYCSEEECNVPIVIRPYADAIITSSVDYQTTKVAYTPAKIIVERQSTNTTVTLWTTIFIIAIVIAVVTILMIFRPKLRGKVITLLNKIGLR